MTTNIRNIMSVQDKGLLTASSRLLHAEVRHTDLKATSYIGKDLSPKNSKSI